MPATRRDVRFQNTLSATYLQGTADAAASDDSGLPLGPGACLLPPRRRRHLPGSRLRARPAELPPARAPRALYTHLIARQQRGEREAFKFRPPGPNPAAPRGVPGACEAGTRSFVEPWGGWAEVCWEAGGSLTTSEPGSNLRVGSLGMGVEGKGGCVWEWWKQKPPPHPQSGCRPLMFFGNMRGSATCRTFHFYLNKPQADIFTLKLCCKGLLLVNAPRLFCITQLNLSAVEGK